jgi:hypothetical protein
MTREELIRLRHGAGNLRTRGVVEILEACGYRFRRHGSDHDVYSKPGYPSIPVQNKMTSGTAISIINLLIRQLPGEDE